MIEGRIHSMTDTRDLSQVNVLGSFEVVEFVPLAGSIDLKIKAIGSFQEAHQLANTDVVIMSKDEYERLIGQLVVT